MHRLIHLVVPGENFNSQPWSEEIHIKRISAHVMIDGTQKKDT